MMDAEQKEIHVLVYRTYGGDNISDRVDRDMGRIEEVLAEAGFTDVMVVVDMPIEGEAVA